MFWLSAWIQVACAWDKEPTLNQLLFIHFLKRAEGNPNERKSKQHVCNLAQRSSSGPAVKLSDAHPDQTVCNASWN